MTNARSVVCEHGSLKRSCPHCELAECEAEIEALRAENERLRAALEEVFRLTVSGNFPEPDYSLPDELRIKFRVSEIAREALGEK